MPSIYIGPNKRVSATEQIRQINTANTSFSTGFMLANGGLWKKFFIEQQTPAVIAKRALYLVGEQMRYMEKLPSNWQLTDDWTSWPETQKEKVN